LRGGWPWSLEKGIAPESQKAIDESCSLSQFDFFALRHHEIVCPKRSGALGTRKADNRATLKATEFTVPRPQPLNFQAEFQRFQSDYEMVKSGVEMIIRS